MINLVHFYDSPGGLEILLPGLIGASSGRDFRAFVIRPHSGSIPSVYSNLNTEVTYGSRRNIRAILLLAKYAIRKKEEIFHVFNIGPMFLLVLRIAGVKRLIYSVHGTVYWHNGIEKYGLKILWLLATHRGEQIITSNSKFSGQVFNKKVNPRIRCELLYNFIDSEKFHGKGSLACNAPVRRIVYVGRLAPGKGLENWIQTAVVIHGAMPEVLFEIYGEGQLKPSLKEKISAAGANGYIHIKGHRKDIENVYREADLLLFLSEYESFGNVVVESLLCETPVLVNDIPAMREILSGFPGLILTGCQATAEEVLKRLTGIEIMRAETLRAGREFRERFSINQHIEKLSRLYDSI